MRSAAEQAQETVMSLNLREKNFFLKNDRAILILSEDPKKLRTIIENKLLNFVTKKSQWANIAKLHQ